LLSEEPLEVAHIPEKRKAKNSEDESNAKKVKLDANGLKTKRPGFNEERYALAEELKRKTGCFWVSGLVDQAHTRNHLLHFTCIYVRSLETEVAWLVNITKKNKLLYSPEI